MPHPFLVPFLLDTLKVAGSDTNLDCPFLTLAPVPPPPRPTATICAQRTIRPVRCVHSSPNPFSQEVSR